MRYWKAPLVEALFELNCVGATWDNSVRDRLEARFRPSFAGKRDIVQPVGLEIQFGPGPQIQQGLRSAPERVRLWTDDNSQLVQFAADMCAYNVMPPYTHFVDYLPGIRALVEAYLSEAKPQGLSALGQRYINKVVLPKKGEAKTYFALYPRLPAKVGREHPPFSMQVQTATLEGGGQVVLTLTYQGRDEGSPTYILDVYARSGKPAAADWNAIEAWQRDAHDAIKRCFELAITPKSRRLFGEQEG